jgi:hypothetical protein
MAAASFSPGSARERCADDSEHLGFAGSRRVWGAYRSVANGSTGHHDPTRSRAIILASLDQSRNTNSSTCVLGSTISPSVIIRNAGSIFVLFFTEVHDASG